MSTVFNFVRHGAYPLLGVALGGRADHALSDQGRAQAARLAAAFAGRPIAAVVSSPVRRARDTAAPIAARLGRTVIEDADFTEIDFGDWTGQRFEALRGQPGWHGWNVFRGAMRIPGGEPIVAVQARAAAGVMRLAAAHPDGEVVVVSHADVIKTVLAHFLGAPLDLMRRLEIAPASISRVELYAEDAKVLAVNLPP